MHLFRAFNIQSKGKLYTFNRPQIMGIVNLTQDSFYDGGRYFIEKQAKKRIDEIISEGVDWIDLGAATTKSGTPLSNPKDEISKLLPIIEYAQKKHPDTLISIDTYQSLVAEACLDAGAHIINDISGGTIDSNIFSVTAKYRVPYILMHIQGTPENMQKKPSYNNLMQDVMSQLAIQIQKALEAGIQDIIIDPGFGFGKTTKHNFELLKKLEAFHIFNRPLLVGFSRKSMIWKTLNTTPQSNSALTGTTALNMYALTKGTQIIRVHDVREAKETVCLFEKL